MADYLAELKNCLDGSELALYPDDYLENEYRFAIHRSVAYMLLTRCGIEADKYLSDFHPITNFNTRNVVNALGLATSDIAEMCLREIAATVRSLQKEEKNQNRTFAKPKVTQYDEKDLQDMGYCSTYPYPNGACNLLRSRRTRGG
jgi:hypothetical protein